MKHAYIFLLSILFLTCKTDALQKQTVKTDYSSQIYFIDQDSSKQGFFVELLLNGDTLSTAEYKDNKLNGVRKIFRESGEVQTIETYSADLFHGPIITYHPNGQMETKGSYSNNVLDSLFYSYFESGELKEKVIMKDNEENGPFEEYYKDGTIHWKGTFINGPNEIGDLLEYDEEGELIKKMVCGQYRGEYICQTIWNVEMGDQKPLLEFDK